MNNPIDYNEFWITLWWFITIFFVQKFRSIVFVEPEPSCSNLFESDRFHFSRNFESYTKHWEALLSAFPQNVGLVSSTLDADLSPPEIRCSRRKWISVTYTSKRLLQQNLHSLRILFLSPLSLSLFPLVQMDHIDRSMQCSITYPYTLQCFLIRRSNWTEVTTSVEKWEKWIDNIFVIRKIIIFVRKCAELQSLLY